MFVHFGKYLPLSDIPCRPLNIPNLRPHFPIAVIDDEPFDLSAALEALEYRITELGDVVSLSTVEVYPIIICDIKNVGAHFSSQFQGAHLVRELRKKYPAKYLIVLSGAIFDARYSDFVSCADRRVSKPAAAEDLASTLDVAIKCFADPIEHWTRTREILLQGSVPLFEVFLVEQAYIRATKRRDPRPLERALEGMYGRTAATEVVKTIGEALLVAAKLIIQFKH